MMTRRKSSIAQRSLPLLLVTKPHEPVTEPEAPFLERDYTKKLTITSRLPELFGTKEVQEKPSAQHQEILRMMRP